MLRLIIAFMCILQAPENPLIIVHVEKQFEGAARAAPEISIEALTKSPIYLLYDSEQWRENTEIPSVYPTESIYAPAGTHQIKLTTKQVTIVGGYFKACFANAVKDIIINSDKPIEIIIPMRGVFYGAKRTLYEEYKLDYKNDKEFLEDMRKVCNQYFGIDNPQIKLQVDKMIITY